MLDEPRELLARALLPLGPPEPPPKPPRRVLAPELGDTLRLPTRSPPPPARFAPELLAPPVVFSPCSSAVGWGRRPIPTKRTRSGAINRFWPSSTAPRS